MPSDYVRMRELVERVSALAVDLVGAELAGADVRPARSALNAALANLKAAGQILADNPPRSPTECAYAMQKLLERIVDEGYVKPDRAPELLERAANMVNGRGFFTRAELKQRQDAEDLLS